MKRVLLVLGGLVAVAGLLGYDVHVLMDRPTDVIGNLEASVIWGTPAAVLFLWRAEVRHRQRMAHLDSLHAKVDRLHQHLGVPQAD